MEILNLTGGSLTVVQTGKNGDGIAIRLPRGALIRFSPSGKNRFVVSVAETSCQTRPFNDADALVAIERVDPCRTRIYRLSDEPRLEDA